MIDIDALREKLRAEILRDEQAKIDGVRGLMRAELDKLTGAIAVAEAALISMNEQADNIRDLLDRPPSLGRIEIAPAPPRFSVLDGGRAT